MNQRSCFATLLCSLILVAVPVVAESERGILQRIADENKMLRMKEIFRKQDVEITFYGKVIDQNGDFIKDANVEIHNTQFNPDMDELFGQVKTVHVQTDATGLFSVENEKGRSVDVEGISKAGYEYLRAQNPATSFEFSKDTFPKPFVADRSSPVIFKLRKKGEATFLVVSPNGNRSSDDLIRTKGTNCMSQTLDLFAWDADAGWRRCATPNADLRIDASFDAEKRNWIVTYAVTNGTGGLIISDSLFYEAPAAGYVPQATVIVTNQEQGCYLYLKSRTPAIYSRIFFNQRYNNRGDPSLRLYCKAWVNPYGERGLEYDTSLEASWRVVDELKNEAIAAIRENKLPPKPDIPQRIKTINEKLEKEKSEKTKGKQ